MIENRFLEKEHKIGDREGRRGYLDKARAGVVIGNQIVGGGHLCDA